MGRLQRWRDAHSIRRDREEVWKRDTKIMKDHQSVPVPGTLLSTRLMKLPISKISVIAMRSITHPLSKYLLNEYILVKHQVGLWGCNGGLIVGWSPPSVQLRMYEFARAAVTSTIDGVAERPEFIWKSQAEMLAGLFLLSLCSLACK